MDGMGSEIDWICSLKEFIAKLSVSLAKVIILSDQGAPGCLGYIGPGDEILPSYIGIIIRYN